MTAVATRNAGIKLNKIAKTAGMTALWRGLESQRSNSLIRDRF